MKEQVNDFEPEIRELVTYTLENSGNACAQCCFSPALVWTARSPEDMVKAAAVVEMVHIATLVHDDILDDATIRHRKETVAQKYGTAVAVLLGDTLFAHALKLHPSFNPSTYAESSPRQPSAFAPGKSAKRYAVAVRTCRYEAISVSSK